MKMSESGKIVQTNFYKSNYNRTFPCLGSVQKRNFANQKLNFINKNQVIVQFLNIQKQASDMSKYVYRAVKIPNIKLDLLLNQNQPPDHQQNTSNILDK